MAIVTATITVDFTANYSGGHRVCWRIQGSGNPYDCTTIVSCVGGGTTCQAIINVDVNTTSCDGTITFEGYVQAACEDVLSTNGRLPWTADFTPNPICNRVEVNCAFGPLANIVVNDGGYCYQPTDTVVITRDPSDTQTLDAIVGIDPVLGDGVLSNINLNAGGINYTPGDVLTIDGVLIIGCAGITPAEVTVQTVDGGTGEILTYLLTNPGAAFVLGGVGSFVTTGGTGSGADFYADAGVDFDPYNSILAFAILLGGAGLYDIAPTITVTSATGTGGSFTAVIEDCDPFLAVGTDCAAATVDLANGLPHGNTVAVCLDDNLVTGVVPDGYATTETGCCIPDDTEIDPNDTCLDYHLENTSGGPIDVQYTACNGIDTTISVGAGVTEAVCAVNGGVVDLDNPDLIITNTGNPCT
jgi:hypothetical protein